MSVFTTQEAPLHVAHRTALPGLDWVRQITSGDPRIRVAVLDGPIDQSHPCFSGAHLEHAQTTVDPANAGAPALGHGTHVASILFGQPGSEVEGLAPSCSGLILPVFASGADEAPVICSQLDLARAINQAITLGAHIINISGGQFTPDGEPEALLAAAVDACVENNVLLIAAAGNEGCECLHVPAAAPAALSVGAMDARGQPLEFSNWGAAYRHHGILAPGQAVIGARAGGGTINKSGTSFATPIVSGVAALLLSAQLARGMRPDPARVHAALLSTATPCDANAISDCRRFLAGAVNPGAALEALLKGELTMSVISTVPANAVAAAAENSAETTPAPVLTSLAAASVLAAEAAPAAAPQELGAAASTVTASDCGCGGGEKCSCGGGGSCTCGNGKGSSLVYALGRLGYDFGTEARRDRFIQFMDSPEPNTPPNPYDPAQMDAYLSANLYEADALIWTLNLDATPIYAIAGGGTFGHLVYDELRKCLSGQLRQGVEIVSIPGGVAGTVRLFSGQVVPLVVPALRGVFAWAKAPLVKSLLGARPSAKKDQEDYDKRLQGLDNFLSRVYYDVRNLGLTPQERALNFAATNAFQISRVIEHAAAGDFELDTINVRKSPVCRPDSDCYDVELAFYNPQNILVSNRVFRFTVDVSDVIPVTIGEVRAWSKRA